MNTHRSWWILIYAIIASSVGAIGGAIIGAFVHRWAPGIPEIVAGLVATLILLSLGMAGGQFLAKREERRQ